MPFLIVSYINDVQKCLIIENKIGNKLLKI